MTQVVPAIDPLANITPPPVDPIAWRDAVQRTRAMLVTVISSNLLDISEMRQLRTELEQSVARGRTHPKRCLANWPQSGTARRTGLDSCLRTAGPRVAIAILRPKILPPRSKKVRTSADQSDLGSLLRLTPGHFARISV